MKSAYFFAIAMFGFSLALLCFLPIILGWKMIFDSTGTAETFTAFKSQSLIIVLGSCLALSIPPLLDIFRDGLLNPKSLLSYKITLSNLLLVFTIFIPDLLMFAYILPYADLNLFASIHSGRMILSGTAAQLYLLSFGGTIWNCRASVVLCLCNGVGNLLFVYCEYFENYSRVILHNFASVFVGSGVGLFTLLVCKWFYFIYKKDAKKQLDDEVSIDDYCCSIYAASSLLIISILCMVSLVYGLPDYYNYDANFLIIVNIAYALYYAVISVFQGGAVRRDEIIRVSIPLEFTSFFLNYHKQLIYFFFKKILFLK